MRKRVLALVLLTSVIFTGCMSTTLEEKQEKQEQEAVKNGDKENSENLQYVNIEDLDFESGHIEGILRENFRIDADVSVNVPAECGTYELARKKQEMTETEYAKYFDEIIDDYVGSDVTTSVIDQENSDIRLIINSEYNNGVFGNYFDKSFNKDSNSFGYFHNKLQVIESNFYEYGHEYDKQFVDGIVNTFIEKCAGIVSDGMNGDYVCIQVDKEYTAALREKYGKDIRIDWRVDGIEYYAIRMYSEIEEGIYFKGLQHTGAYVEDGEETDEVCELQYNEEEKKWYAVSHNPQYLEMIVTEDGKLLSLRFTDLYTIGEKVETNSILDAEEALGAFCKAFDGILMEEELVVKSMFLEYTVDIENEPGEDGYRNATLIPVWVVRYKDCSTRWPDDVERMMTISAIDGSVYAN